MAKGFAIKYHQLNEPGTHILGDKLVIWRGQTWMTKEDLKRFPKVVHLKASPKAPKRLRA